MTADVIELTAANAAGYLRERGVIGDGPVEIVELGGGISNVVLKVSPAGEEPFVVKQSLPRLRVAAEWRFDRARILNERACMDYLAGILPAGSVPAVRFADDANFTFGMSCAPPGGVLWKAALMAGEVDLDVARRAGALLAQLQERASRDPAAAEGFVSQSVLVEGRIDPYHRSVAARHRDLAPAIEREIERMLGTRSTLVLGDYAPKNAFAYPDRLLILDFEVAHWGDPAFDPAFCLTHLVLKALHFRDDRYLAAAGVFWRAYTAGRAEVDETAVLRELGCLLVARVDGKSQAEYLVDEAVREDVRRLGRRCLTGDAIPIAAVLESAAAGPAREPAA